MQPNVALRAPPWRLPAHLRRPEVVAHEVALRRSERVHAEPAVEVVPLALEMHAAHDGELALQHLSATGIELALSEAGEMHVREERRIFIHQ